MGQKLQYDFFQIGQSPEKAIVAIHGWQGNRKSMQPLMVSMKLKRINWYFLEAPYPVDGNENSKTWSYEISRGKWEVEEPRRLLYDFFNKLFQEIPSENVYVMGFSQGGLVCLDFVLHLDHPLGGVFSIAGFLRQPKNKKQRYHFCQKETPILISHGKGDDRVPVKASELAYEQLKEQGANVELLLYNGRHKIGVESIRKIREIILK